MLHTMKCLVIQMIPQLTNNQRSNLLYQQTHEILHTQPPTYLYKGIFLHHLYLPQTIPYSHLTNISTTSSTPKKNISCILAQSTQGVTPLLSQILSQPKDMRKIFFCLQ